MALRLRNITLFTLLSLLTLGAVALTGLWHPNAPDEMARVFLPQITLPAVVVAGLVDGINPCAFTVLLLFITAMTSTLGTGEANSPALKTRLLGMGSVYIAAVFLTYLALGVGLLKSFDFFTRQHVPARLGAMVAVLLGLWMLKDYFLPDVGWRLQAPGRLGSVARQMGKRASLPGLVTGGFLIGLCTVPCSGAVYLGVLSLLALQPTRALGYGYLVLYNLIFILPLVGILVAATARPTLRRLVHWNLHHKEYMRLVLGGGVVLMGLAILATV